MNQLFEDIPATCDMMMPARIALKCIDELGFILRSDIIWAKQILIKKENKTLGSVMPTSVKNRFNQSYEHLYFFVKNKRYYSNLDAVRLPNQYNGIYDFRPADLIMGARRGTGGYSKSKYQQQTYNPQFNYRVRDAERKVGQPQFKASEEETTSQIARKYGYEPEELCPVCGRSWKRHASPNAKAIKEGLRREFIPCVSKNYQGKFLGNPDVEMFNSPRARTQRKSLDERMDDTKNKDQKSIRTYNIKKLLSEVRLGIKPNTGMEPNKVNDPRKKFQTGYEGGKKLRKAPPNAFNPLGKNLPSVWLIQVEPHNFKKELEVDVDHFATFPQALLDIPIRFGCPEFGTVLDPFAGSGTTALVCEQLSRNSISIDLNKKYCEIAYLRLKKQMAQTKITGEKSEIERIGF